MGRQAATPRIISKALGPKRSVKMSLIDASCFPLTALLVLYITRWRVFDGLCVTLDVVWLSCDRHRNRVPNLIQPNGGPSTCL